MNRVLPAIVSAGLFESETSFPNLTVTNPRTVLTYELEYFFESGGTAIINGNSYPIKRGQVLFASPGDIRYSRLPFTCRFLHFTVSDPTISAALENLAPVFSVTDPKKTEELFCTVTGQFYSANPFDNLHACAGLICLLHLLTSRADESLNTVAKAQQFIQDNYREPISTQSIAQACGVSSSYLHKLFRTVLSTTPGAYLLSCRISAARELLANTSLPLSEIAFRCGFNSQSYFSDCFKRSMGICPLEFRKNAAYLL